MSLKRGLFSVANEQVRKSLALFLIAALLLAIIFPVLQPAFAYEPGSGILDAGHSKDVFLNIDAAMLDEFRTQTGNPSLSIEDIAADLKAQLILLDPEQYNEVNIRIQYNETQINTTDLSTWYVYDHYYSGGGYGEYMPYADNDPNVFNEMRPYYPTTNEAVAWPTAGSNPTKYYTDNGISLPWSPPPSWLAKDSTQALSGVFTIKQLLDFGTEAGMVKNGSLAGNYLDASGNPTGGKYPNARRLKEHIYSGADENGAFMYFMGYGSSGVTPNGNCKTDFLFYPAQDAGRKKIEFQINSADVRTHSMNGAGFLLNTSIVKVDENPANNEIKGYVLYITFEGTSPDKEPNKANIELFRINDNTKVDYFHTRKELAAKTDVYATNYMTSVATATNSAAAFGSGTGFKPVLDIIVEFDDTGFYLMVTDPDTDVTTLVTFNNSTSSNITQADGFTSVDLATGAYGFGPLVDFGFSGHSCATVSAFKFSNLKMSMQTDIFKELRESHYFTAQNVDRYFVNLSTEPIDPEAAPDFWDGIARLRTDKIFYVSNNDDGVIDNGDTEGANDKNGTTLTKTDYEEMIAELAAYIHNTGTEDWSDEDLPELQITVPVAISSIIGWDDHTIDSGEGEKPLFRIERAMTDANPVTVALHDRSTISRIDDPEAKITHLEIVAYDPEGVELYKEIVKVNETGVYELFTLGSDHEAPLGTYTVEMTAIWMDPDGETVISRSPNKSVNTFELIEDIYWPQVTLDNKIPISDEKTSEDFLDPESTRTESKDGAVYNIIEGVYEGNDAILRLTDNKKEPQHDDWGVQAYLISDPLHPDKYAKDETVLPDLWPEYLIALNDLGSGLRDVTVTVWDWVGHMTVYTLKVNPRVNTLTVSVGAEPDFLGDDADKWDEVLEKLRTRFSDLFVREEEVDVADVSEFPLVNGYKLIGFTTDPEGTEPMDVITVTDEHMTLYPIFKDVTPPSIDFGDTFNSGYISGKIKIIGEDKETSMIWDNNTTPLTGDDVEWYILEYDPMDMRPVDDILADKKPVPYKPNEDGEIDLASLELDPDKEYFIYVKATDAEGNAAGKTTAPFKYDVRTPAISIGGSEHDIDDDTVTRYVTTVLTFSGESGVADPAGLSLEYTVNGVPQAPVSGLEDFMLELIPPAEGEDDNVYEFTITDASGRVMTKKIVVKPTGSIMEVLSDVNTDNVNSGDEELVSGLTDIISGLLDGEGSDGMTQEEEAILKETQDELDALMRKIRETKSALDDIAEELSELLAGGLSANDIPALRSSDSKAEEFLTEFEGNLTEEEKALINGFRSEIAEKIRSLSWSPNDYSGNTPPETQQPEEPQETDLSEEGVEQDVKEGDQENAADQAGDQDGRAGRAGDQGTDGVLDQEQDGEEPDLHPNIILSDDVSIHDFPSIDFYNRQPDPDTPGGTHPGIPPNPNLIDYMLIPYINEHGAVFFVEIDELSSPLGEWFWDSEQGIWIFEQYAPLGEYNILPQTGVNGAICCVMLLSGALLASAGFAARRRQKERES